MRLALYQIFTRRPIRKLKSPLLLRNEPEVLRQPSPEKNLAWRKDHINMLPVQHNIDVSRSRNSGMVMLDVDGGGAAGLSLIHI